MASCHLIVAGIIGASKDDFATQVRCLGRSCLYLCINFGYSWDPVAWIVISEVFPLSMRAKGVAIGGSSNWLNNFAVEIATSPFISKTQFGGFIFFGVITLIGAFWVYFFVPETKGRTLEEMDELFGSTGLAAADDERKRRIEQEIGLLVLLGEDDSGVEDSKTASEVAIESANKHVEATDLPIEKA